jgi:glucose dehydrogenase
VWKGDRSEPTTLRQLPGGVSTPSTTPGFTSVTPHDEWDYDGINEMILADINVGGQARKVLVHFDRNGFGYTLDRTNGELLVAEKYDPKVNWATKVATSCTPAAQREFDKAMLYQHSFWYRSSQRET